MRALALAVLFLITWLGEPAISRAETWPSRPIKLIVASGPGLATDIMARMLAERLSPRLGQTIYVENMAGAAGIVGTLAAARSAPDGYTLYFGSGAVLSLNTYIYKAAQYDPLRDFVPIAMVCDQGPFVVSVQPDLPIKTLPDLIAYAKAHPGTMSYAADTSSTNQVMIGQLIGKRANIDWTLVPYKSTAQMLQDTAAGVVQAVISSVPAVYAFASSGRLRMIAISSDKRFPGLDDIAPIAETLPNFNFNGWFAMVGPVGLPPEIIERLNKEIGVVMADPELLAKLRTLGLSSSGAGTPQSTGAFIQSEQRRWATLVKELNIQPQ